jgi:hypothetical protein
MNIVITNISSSPVYVSDLFTTIAAGGVLRTTRAQSDLSRMVSLQNYLAAGTLTMVATATSAEEASGTLYPDAAQFVSEEWDAPVAASTNGIMHATATVNGPVTYVPTTGAAVTTGALFNPAGMAVGAAPRNVTIAGGGTTGQCPTSAVLTGFDGGGNAQTETIALTAGAGTGVKGWSSLTSVKFLGGTGTAGTEAIGWGVSIGLKYLPALRAGTTSPYAPFFPEIEDGAVAGTPGSLSNPGKLYTPHDAPNGTHSYAVYYEAVQ